MSYLEENHLQKLIAIINKISSKLNLTENEQKLAGNHPELFLKNDEGIFNVSDNKELMLEIAISFDEKARNHKSTQLQKVSIYTSFAISLVLAAISLVTSCLTHNQLASSTDRENKELNLKELELMNKLIDELESINTNNYKKLSIAYQLKSVEYEKYLDLTFRAYCDTTYTIVKKEVTQRKKEVESLEKTNIDITTGITNGVATKINKHKNTFTTDEKTSTKEQSTEKPQTVEADSILLYTELKRVGDTKDIADIKKLSAKVESFEKNAVSIYNKKSILEGFDFDDHNWAKGGYYQETPNNKIRVWVQYVYPKDKKAHITVTLRNPDNGKEIQTFFDGMISVGESCLLKHEEIDYVFKLLDIAPAGKNPFTKAAYFSITNKD